MPDRRIEHNRSGPVTLELDVDAAQIMVIDSDVDRATVTLTAAENDTAAAESITQATAQSSGDRLTITIPSTGGSVGGVQIGGDNYGRIVIQQSFGTIERGSTVIGASIDATGDVYVGGSGVVQTGSTSGITITAQVPHASSLDVQTVTGTVTTRGQLQRVSHRGSSGHLQVETADEVDTSTQSGAVRIGYCRSVRAKTMSGAVTVDELAGSAETKSMSGSIRVHAVADSRVDAKSMSGNVTVTQRDAGIRVDVNARSMSGQVRVEGGTR